MEHLALGKYILVELASDEKVSKGGILLPDDQVQANCKRSRVVSVSEDLLEMYSQKNRKFPLKVGDIVYHAFHIGTPLTTHDDKKLTAIHIDNVLSVEIG